MGVELIVILYSCVFIVGFSVVKYLGGIKRNLPFFFYLVISVVYYMVTPLYFYMVGRETVWGTDLDSFIGIGVNIADYYVKVLCYYALALLFVIFGFCSLPRKKSEDAPTQHTLYNPRRKIVLIYAVAYFLVFIDFFMAGINPIEILLGTSEKTMFVMVATTNYLRNFADTIVITLIIAYFYQVKRSHLWIMIILAFILFTLLGFRYRIIISLFGIFFVYLYKSRFQLKVYLRLLLFLGIFAMFVLFITVNRSILINGDYSNLKISPSEYEYGLIFEQTRGMLADMNVIKYMEVIDPQFQYDYGVTFFYFIVRALPRSIIGSEFKDSLYPAPAPKLIMKAYMLPSGWGETVGEAPLHYVYFYIAGGIVGLILLSFLTGVFYKWWSNRFPPNCAKNVLLQVILSIITFQWITRGYLPQTIDHFSFLLIGYFLFYYISTRKFRMQ